MSAWTLDTPIQKLSGIGERRAALFRRLGIETAYDLLRHYPRHYEDWIHTVPIAQAPTGIPCCVRATVLCAPAAHRIRAGLTLYKFTASDGETGMQITLFNTPYAAAKIVPGRAYRFYGQISRDFLRAEMSSPQIEPEGEVRIRAVYPQTEGLSSKRIAAAVADCLKELETALEPDFLPASIRQELGLCSRREALRAIHFPADFAELEAARRRLVFEELFLLQLGLLQLKTQNRRTTAIQITTDYTEEFLSLLPFTPTGAQRRAMADNAADLQKPVPMNRLLQGDVGSGKTVVAAAAAYNVIRSGYQAALMAPTEVLAKQHAASLKSLLEPAGIQIGLLTGSTKAAQKQQLRQAAAEGSLDLLIGTHALLEEDTAFARLGLVITDEQHRFGVAQRARLAGKGHNPHTLVMSATPIPRTLALLVYGDLDVSVLDERPPGRQPIATYAIRTDKRQRAYAFIKKHLDQGRQAYIVCPLVEEGETDLISATAYFRQLAEGPFQGYSLGLLHGRMKAAEKEQVMAAFSENALSILVSTTVIEVGVDVPNAVLMVIENAERFGLAQLHQLRGRVGRGTFASSCILISDARGEEATRRLKILCATDDGFVIAEEDLKLRGPGDFFGSRQHGLPPLKIADLTVDMSQMNVARTAAISLLQADPTLEREEHYRLKEEVRRLFGRAGEGGLN